MSNKIRPWRKKDKKHYKRQFKIKGKKILPIKKLAKVLEFEALSYEHDDPTLVVK